MYDIWTSMTTSSFRDADRSAKQQNTFQRPTRRGKDRSKGVRPKLTYEPIILVKNQTVSELSNHTRNLYFLSPHLVYFTLVWKTDFRVSLHLTATNESKTNKTERRSGRMSVYITAYPGHKKFSRILEQISTQSYGYQKTEQAWAVWF